ncbi:Noc2-domain-containing protein [Teratosphaeria nubilosa]|uniref:Noc2-domain-containing protein n=1 Tax=Teratosphaeria nubilosa TaxID=161662 RepID=A0A6G1L2G6_9PEZI|nr:Noc2-domain-containing protein [Teratosphaeria nubilosa]
MAQKKATKKFEQRHLKDTLDRRNGLKKNKQKQQLKAKKKARRVEENGGPEETTAVQKGRAKGGDAFKDMSVDAFFQGGFEVPELPKPTGNKRKRRAAEDEAEAEAESESDVSFEQQPVVAPADDDDDDDDASDSEDDEDFKAQLDALKQRDPAFHKHLQEDEPELLDADLDDLELSDDDGEDDVPKRKKQRTSTDDDDESEAGAAGGGKNELDGATVKKWQKALAEEHSLRAAKDVVLAFRSAAHVTEDEDRQFKYAISDPHVYHQLLTVALRHIPAVFQHHLPVQESKSGKVHVATESKKFKNLAPLLRSHMASITHLLGNLSDPATLRLTLTSALPLLPYLLSFKKLLRDVARAAADVWSTPSSTEATRIAAFLVLRRLIVIGDSGIRENVFKATYQGLIKGSRTTTVHTIAGVNLMKNSAAELWGLADSSVAYTTGFTFIRQLAIHLRSSITNNSNESYKTVYNWQYVHSLDFWSRVLSSHAVDPASPLRPLIYPLVQVTLGALRLIPTATYFPLRFQLIRSLLRLSHHTNTFIPLAPALYEVLNSAEMRKAPKASTLKPLEFDTSIRAAKSYLRTRTYQDGTGEQVAELLSEFLAIWSKNIAFPELALPIIIALKRWLKEVQNRNPGKGNKNQKVNSLITLLVQKIEANSRFIEEKRAKVEFAPNDRKGVEGFLREVNWDKTPLGAFVAGQRKTREAKRKMVEESRVEEEKRRESERVKEREERDGREFEGVESEWSEEDDGSDVEMSDNGELDEDEEESD